MPNHVPAPPEIEILFYRAVSEDGQVSDNVVATPIEYFGVGLGTDCGKALLALRFRLWHAISENCGLLPKTEQNSPTNDTVAFQKWTSQMAQIASAYRQMYPDGPDMPKVDSVPYPKPSEFVGAAGKKIQPVGVTKVTFGQLRPDILIVCRYFPHVDFLYRQWEGIGLGFLVRSILAEMKRPVAYISVMALILSILFGIGPIQAVILAGLGLSIAGISVFATMLAIGEAKFEFSLSDEIAGRIRTAPARMWRALMRIGYISVAYSTAFVFCAWFTVAERAERILALIRSPRRSRRT